jgi:MinD superfamily P-loop ATPase
VNTPREIVVLSGKGGSGKTSVTASLAHLVRESGIESLICDLDVDTPDLHILLRPEVQRRAPFISGHLAHIDPDLCAACGLCAEVCRFDAIQERDGAYAVAPLACEGCRVCVDACPVDAIAFDPRRCGEHMVSETRFGPMVHAQLDPGQENSGRLVSLLRRRARDLAGARGAELVLSDGTPGIGCPVIASVSGTDLAVLVAEPSPSGLHDLERVIDLTAHFGVPAAVVINRADLYPEGTEQTRQLAERRGLPCLGEIPLDLGIVDAQVQRKTLTEWASGPAAAALASIWRELRELLRLPSDRADGSRRAQT